MASSGKSWAAASAAEASLPEKLAVVLLRSLENLASAGEAEAACRYAGQACVALRNADPKIARRFDVFLHRQTKHLSW